MNRQNNNLKTIFLRAEDILSYFLAKNKDLETVITCKPAELQLQTSDQELYEALGSIRSYDDFQLQRFVKFLESVDVHSFHEHEGEEKKVLTFERLEELRKAALKKGS